MSGGLGYHLERSPLRTQTGNDHYMVRRVSHLQSQSHKVADGQGSAVGFEGDADAGVRSVLRNDGTR